MFEARSNDPRRSRSGPVGLAVHRQPGYFRAILAAVWQNRKNLSYAWNILNHTVCAGCSFGSDGLRDDSNGGGVHLCVERLAALRYHVIEAVDAAALSDATRLRTLEPRRLRALGRLAHPMIRRRGQRGFLRVSWDEALDVIAKTIRRLTPQEMAFLATPRGLTNETYYTLQKLARSLGTNNIALWPLADREGAISALRTTLGYGASTCSLADLIGAELVVVFGSERALPVLQKHLRQARKAGARVLLVSEANDSPPETDSRMPSDTFQIHLGGTGAFINGILKFLVHAERTDRQFIEGHTAGFAELAAHLDSQTWDFLERRSGTTREEMQSFAEAYSRARTAVFVCAGHLDRNGKRAESVKSIVNLALARGMVGRENCGIVTIHDEHGAQGAADCGVDPDGFPAGFAMNDEAARRFSNLWHHPAPTRPGLAPSAVIGAASEGRIKLLYSLGADLLESAADPDLTESALAQVPLRVHQDIWLNASMLSEPGEAVILLPGQTCFEQRTGGTSTNTERRIRFTPEIPGRRIGDALPAWEIPIFIGRKAMSNGDKLFPFTDTQSIREEMSRIMPIYQGIENLTKEGDQLQWGGPQLYQNGFTAMPEHRARFTVINPLDGKLP